MPERSGITLRELRERPVTALKGVTPRLAASLGRAGHRHRPRPPRALPAPLPRPHQPGRDRQPGRRRGGDRRSARCKKVTVRRPRKGRPIVELEVFDGTSLPRLTFFNQAWPEPQPRGGHRGLGVRPARACTGVDARWRTRSSTSSAAPGRRRHRRDRARVPAVGQGRGAFTWQLRTPGRPGARAVPGPAGSATRSTRGCATTAGSLDRTAAILADPPARHSIAEAQAARARLVFDEFLRMQVGLVVRTRAHRTPSERASATPSTGRCVDAFLAALPFPLTGDQQRAIAEITADLAGPGADAPAAAGRRRLGQDRRRAHRAARRGAGRLPGRVHGAHRGARRAAHAHPPGAARGRSPSRPPGRCSATGRCASSCSPAAPRPPSGAASPPACATGRSTSSSAPTPCSTATPSSPHLGVAVIDEQHRFGVEQRDAAQAKAKGDDARRARDDRDADPAHRGDARLRRPRQVRAARAARRADADRHRAGRAEPARPGRACTSGSATEVAAGHQAYVVCPLVEDKGEVEAKAATAEFERLQAGGARRACGSASSTASCPRQEKEAVMAALPGRRARRARRHHRHRGRRRRAERDRHGRRGRRPLRALAAPPAPRPGRAGRRRLVVLPRRRPDHPGRRGAHGGDRGSTDGFELAEKDLEIRGAGEVFGERQSGISDLKLGRIPATRTIVLEARRARRGASSTTTPTSRVHAQLRDEVEDLPRRRGRVPLQELMARPGPAG